MVSVIWTLSFFDFTDKIETAFQFTFAPLFRMVLFSQGHTDFIIAVYSYAGLFSFSFRFFLVIYFSFAFRAILSCL